MSDIENLKLEMTDHVFKKMSEDPAFAKQVLIDANAVMKEQEQQITRLRQELRHARDDISTVRGLLGICKGKLAAFEWNYDIKGVLSLKEGVDFIGLHEGWFFYNANHDPHDGPDGREIYISRKASLFAYINDPENPYFSETTEGFCFSVNTFLCTDGDMEEDDAVNHDEKMYPGGPYRLIAWMPLPAPPKEGEDR